MNIDLLKECILYNIQKGYRFHYEIFNDVGIYLNLINSSQCIYDKVVSIQDYDISIYDKLIETKVPFNIHMYDKTVHQHRLYFVCHDFIEHRYNVLRITELRDIDKQYLDQIRVMNVI